MTANDIIRSLDGAKSKSSDAVEAFITILASDKKSSPALIGFAAGVGARWLADQKRIAPIQNAARSLGQRGGVKGGAVKSEAARARQLRYWADVRAGKIERKTKNEKL